MVSCIKRSHFSWPKHLACCSEKRRVSASNCNAAIAPFPSMRVWKCQKDWDSSCSYHAPTPGQRRANTSLPPTNSRQQRKATYIGPPLSLSQKDCPRASKPTCGQTHCSAGNRPLSRPTTVPLGSSSPSGLTAFQEYLVSKSPSHVKTLFPTAPDHSNR